MYNTLDALTKAGVILRLSVDPSATRYDAHLGPHAHFRCRACGKIYDIPLSNGNSIDLRAGGHRVESVRTYAYGVCAACLAKERSGCNGDTGSSPIETKEGWDA